MPQGAQPPLPSSDSVTSENSFSKVAGGRPADNPFHFPDAVTSAESDACAAPLTTEAPGSV
jgi:hypothetical protein